MISSTLKTSLGKVKKVPVLKDGETNDFVCEWVLHEGVEVPKLCAKPPEFAQMPSFDGEEELLSLRSQLAENEALSSATDTGIARRDERMASIKKRIAALEKKRDPLTTWELQEITNCLFGWYHLTGRQYFYIRHCWIYENVEGGGKQKIKPLYRMWDNWLFRRIEKAMRDCTGLFGGKRRQYGATFISAADDLYDMIFLSSNNFFISKEKDDIRKYYDRVGLMHDALPAFMRKPLIRNGAFWKTYAPLENITAVKRHFGLLRPDAEEMDANLRSASQANSSAAAGDTVSKIRMDEIGEFDSPREVIGIADPMLLKGNSLKRSGPIIAMGTVGKISRVGNEFETIYRNAAAWDLEQIFITGWMGIEPDELGNEDRKKITQAIQKRVEAFEKAGLMDEALEYRQQHPLTVEDMFAASFSQKLLPAQLLNKAKSAILDDPPPYRYGRFYISPDGVRFMAEQPQVSSSVDKRDYRGYNQVTILEDRIKLPYNNVYVGGVDPVDTKRDEYGETAGTRRRKDVHSDISFTIIKCKGGLNGDYGYPVCWYHGRPDDPLDAYEQLALAAIYYGEAQANGHVRFNIEAQRGAALMFYLQTHRFNGISVVDVISVGAGMAMGITKTARQGFAATPAWWTDMITLARGRIKQGWWYIKWDRLLDELIDIRERNTDAAVGYLAALQLAEETGALEAVGMAQSDPSKTRKMSAMRQMASSVPSYTTNGSYMDRLLQKRRDRHG